MFFLQEGAGVMMQVTRKEVHMDQLLGVADAARILGVVPATVRQMERDGRLPAQKTASGVRIFRRVDVERLASERERYIGARHTVLNGVERESSNGNNRT
jgi:predicted site-specific integrase-resolvase